MKEATNATDPEGGEGRGVGGGYCEYSRVRSRTLPLAILLLLNDTCFQQELLQLAPLAFVKKTSPKSLLVRAKKKTEKQNQDGSSKLKTRSKSKILG